MALVEQILNGHFTIDSGGAIPNLWITSPAKSSQRKHRFPGLKDEEEVARKAKGTEKPNCINKLSVRAIERDLSPYELLLVPQVAIEDELPPAHFDYFAFHHKC